MAHRAYNNGAVTPRLVHPRLVKFQVLTRQKYTAMGDRLTGEMTNMLLLKEAACGRAATRPGGRMPCSGSRKHLRHDVLARSSAGRVNEPEDRGF